MPYVYSTLTSSQVFPLWDGVIKGVNHYKKSIFIEGGHGVMNKNFMTPKHGVITEVTEEELEQLQNMDSFNYHIKKGNFVVTKKKVAKEKVHADMRDKDESSPITPEDILAGRIGEDKILPTVGDETVIKK